MPAAPDSPAGVGGARPNLFLVGAPKSGTTALATYLGEHPDVFVAPWELHYFGSDLDFRSPAGAPRRLRLDHYLSTFAPHRLERHRGDHSVFYLSSTAAAAEIHDFEPEARIIVMLRDPVDQMHAQHSEMLYQGDEDIADFAVALGAEAERRAGRRIPPGCRKPFALQYRSLARYHGQVERYLTSFGPHQVCIVLFDELVRDPAATYRRVLEFLEVDERHQPEFRLVNPNKDLRSPKLRDVLRETTTDAQPGFRRLGRLVVRSDRARGQLRRWLHAVNTRHRPRPPLDPALRTRLQGEMADDVRRLEGLVQRDLGAWLAPPQ